MCAGWHWRLEKPWRLSGPDNRTFSRGCFLPYKHTQTGCGIWNRWPSGANRFLRGCVRSRVPLLGMLTVLCWLFAVACGGGDDATPTSVNTPTSVPTPTTLPTSEVTSEPPTSPVTSVPATPTVGAGDQVTVGMNTFLNVPDNVAPQALWCYQCHFAQDIPEAGGLLGPDLSHIGTDAANRKPGLSAEEYIRESIRDPQGFICDVERCTAGLMTSAITENLTDVQVDGLVAFLLTLE